MNELSNGYVTPQAIDVEKGVLGALMLERDAISKAIAIISPECFYLPVHCILYETILQLYRDNTPIDLLSVSTKLMDNETVKANGGIAYVSSLTSLVASAVNLEYMCKILVQKRIAREVIEGCSEIIKSAYDSTIDVSEVIDKLDKTCREIDEMACGRLNIRHIKESVSKALIEAENRQKMAMSGVAVGVDTGIHELNVITGGGWKPSQLIVLAGRPAMGKTAVLLHLAKSAAKNDTPVCIYSLEMSDVSLANRLMLSECDIDIDRFKTGRMTDSEYCELNRAAGVIEKLPIYVDSNPIVSMEYIRSHSKIMKDKGRCGLILVDYLQLADTGKNKNRNREQEIAQASRMAKIIAKELDVPFILLSQLSRGVEGRADKIPQLSDLRESGAIEQDADSVIFIYRPAYYDKQSVRVKCGNSYNEISSEGVGILLVEKQRDGATGSVKFRHNPSMTKITDFETDYYGNPF